VNDNLHFALEGAWKVLLAGLVLGAGLPAVFALGIRSLAWGQGGAAETSHGSPHPIGKVLAGICFLVVVYGILAGILIIVASGMGKDVSFSHVWPQFSEAS
jgi:hypothetical protein